MSLLLAPIESSLGMTIADFVQQVLYAMYKVRLDVTHDSNLPQAFHADTDKFKEIVMEGNFVLQDLQKTMDWNWLRMSWQMGTAARTSVDHVQSFRMPENAYKVCTGFNDAVRLHNPDNGALFVEVPFTSPRSARVNTVSMFDTGGRLNVSDHRMQAFVTGRNVSFTRPFFDHETGAVLETDVIRRLDDLHICDSTCAQPCTYAYQVPVFTEIPDPYYMVVKTAAKKAEGDPSIADRVMGMADEANKLLSAMRQNDSAKTVPDTYTTAELGYTRIL